MFDVLIVGGGMVGASLACGLRDSHLKVGLIEPRSDYGQGDFGADGRASAVALGSVLYWQKIGVWQEMLEGGATPMHTIQITDGEYPYALSLHCQDMGVEALGYVVPNRVTLGALWRAIKRSPNLELICPGRVIGVTHGETLVQVDVLTDRGISHLSTKLLVAADGNRSPVREMEGIPVDRRTYDQTCLVATVQTAFPHHNTAYERFRSSGPFAILPLDTDRCCVVWTVHQKDVPYYLGLNRSELEGELQQRFARELGEVHLLSEELAYYVPQWMHARTYTKPRFLVVGDAAHTTHPVAGQGMNLGIRDVAHLVEVLRRATDPGDAKLLRAYQSGRYWDNLGVILLTDCTNRLFSNQTWWCQGIRRLGLALLQIKPLKRLLMYFMMGLHCMDAHLAPTDSLPRSLR